MWGRSILYVLVPLVVTLSSGALIVLGGARLAYPDDYPDPFAPFEAMMPGHFVMALEDHPPCDLQTTSGYTLVISCNRLAPSIPFASIFSNGIDGRFVRTEINYLQDLYVGDIVRHWGRPDMVAKFDYRTYYALWREVGLVGIIDLAEPIGRFNYMSPVEHITISFRVNDMP